MTPDILIDWLKEHDVSAVTSVHRFGLETFTDEQIERLNLGPMVSEHTVVGRRIRLYRLLGGDFGLLALVD